MRGVDVSTLIIGCGNLLRRDDGVGPTLIRRLWALGPPSGVRLADGGTAGMDVVFQIQDAKRLIIVDAAKTGAEPGTIFELPGAKAETPPLTAVNLHDFRWDHALAVGRWLLKERFPEDVTIYLIEAKDLEYGVGLSPEVEAAMERLAALLVQNAGGEPQAQGMSGG
ncbi:hydrogenase maturation protease [Hydrogenibacillus schlegelii]|uniref:Hydrogenase maturation protease n=1 Tax=Hydrogenibacillus schlegelii TaxID=1484 RepID=A0A132N8F1_HYDSH|nr:hydrogenase maturation protease [Hydrogenibacillus schlegelii]MBT9281810.1 hydrogenase maturation protease [Hydrogenibacillus schlegelii]OAR03348.1 hydrogenase maturation protease [Hydrogenibacillus schlegelii]